MENQLEVIVSQSGLDKSKSQILLDNFSNYFQIAAEWEQKAKMLIVTDVSQRTEMKMAREGRLFLKDKRVSIENSRKELKEQSLREGQTIDAIAKILKNLIEPIEKHLEQQEKFVEIKQAQEKEDRKSNRVTILTELEFDFTYTDLLNMDDNSFDQLVLQIENAKSAKIEAERKAKAEKEEAEELERKRIAEVEAENKRLQEEAKERERFAEIERVEAAKILAAQEEKAKAEREEAERKLKAIEEAARIEKEKAQAKADAERKELEQKEAARIAEQKRIDAINEAKLKEAKDAKLRIENELAAKKAQEEADAKAKQLAERNAKLAPDKEKLEAFAKLIADIPAPQLASNEAMATVIDAMNLLQKTAAFIHERANKM